MKRISRAIIIAVFFIRPFVSQTTFPSIDFYLCAVFLLSCLFYLRKRRIKTEFIDIVIFAFFFSILLSMVISRNIVINQIYKYGFLLSFFYIGKVSKPFEKKQFIVTIALSSLLVSLYSLRGLFIVSPSALNLLLDSNTTHNFANNFIAAKRAFMPFITPNLLAGYSSMTAFICLGAAMGKNSIRKPGFILFISCFVLNLASLAFSKSIGAWSIFIPVLFLMLFLARKLNKNNLLFIFCLAIILLFIIFARNNTACYFKKPLFSLQQRLYYWKNTFVLIVNNPFFGWGMGNFNLAQSRYAHNSYLQIWAESGILAVGSLLLIVFTFIKRFLKKIHSHQSTLEIGLFSAAIFFILHNLVDFSFYTNQISYLWWFIIGTAFSRNG